MAGPLISDMAAKRIIKDSGLFDPAWYLRQNADVRGLRKDALTHYIQHGAGELRDPSPLFSGEVYLSQFTGLDPQVTNPLCHYLLIGESLGARPNILFDPVVVRTMLKRPLSDNLFTEVLKNPELIVPLSNEFSSEDYLKQHPYLRTLRVHPIQHALYQYSGDHCLKDKNLELSNLDLQISHVFQLSLTSRVSGYLIHEVLGDDPHMIFENREESAFAPGHFRLSLTSLNKLETLRSAKVYIDYGDGFSETWSQPLFFRKLKSNRFVADFSVHKKAKRIRFDPFDIQEEKHACFAVKNIELDPLERHKYYVGLIKDLSHTPLDFAVMTARFGANIITRGPKTSATLLKQTHNEAKLAEHGRGVPEIPYNLWIERYERRSHQALSEIRERISSIQKPPLFSIILPVYNSDLSLLRECIDSVLQQHYPYWELCIADDCSQDPRVRAEIRALAAKDERIKYVFRSKNGHISRASNSALELATGEWIALLDHDDIIPSHALYQMTEAILSHPEAKLFYSDEDKIDELGNRCEPYFKSDWNERLFFEQNMISHFGVYDRQLIEKIGGFREGYEGAQDHDLALRFIEQIAPDHIVHVPEILYHWRITPGSTAKRSDEKSYAIGASVKAVKDAIKRRNLNASVEANPGIGYCRLKFAPSSEPQVSIIIPTRDGLDVLKPCIQSICDRTDYKNYEIIIADNQSKARETLEFFNHLEHEKIARVIKYDKPFNFSAINNFAVDKCTGPLICFLNNDTEIIAKDWLSEMVCELQQPGIGAVGAKLLYSDRTVQHAGVILGVGVKDGVAGHGLLGIGQHEGGYFSYGLLSRETSAVTAACMLTTREVFETVGGFNEQDLAVAFNDIDLCLKIREAALKIIWTPHALLHHHESKSRGQEDTPEKQARFTKEVEYMLRTWGEKLKLDPYYNPNLSLNARTYSLSTNPRGKSISKTTP